MDFIDSAVEKGNNQYDDSIELGKKFPKGTEVVYTGAREDERGPNTLGIVHENKFEGTEMTLSVLFDKTYLIVWDLNKEEHIQDLEGFMKKNEKKGMFGYSGGKKTRRRTKRGGKKIHRKTNKRRSRK